MPLYEYDCLSCHQRFEALVRDATPPVCPACQSHDLERVLSLFGVSSDATRQATLTRARAAQRRVQREKSIAAAEEEEHHRH
jgi:putative FmdB family regulatory protein